MIIILYRNQSEHTLSAHKSMSSQELMDKQAELAYLLAIRDSASQILTSFDTLNQKMDNLILEAEGKQY